MISPTIFLVGFGKTGHKHLDIITGVLPAAKIYLIHHSNTRIIESSDLDPRIHGRFWNYDDAVLACESGQIQLDVLFICNPTRHHLKTAWTFAKLEPLSARPKAIFIESPISHSTVGVVDFVSYCFYNHIVLHVGYVLRFSETLSRLKNILSQGSIGKILSVQLNVGQHTVTTTTTTTTKTTNNQGALLELSQDLDYLLWLFGFNLDSIDPARCDCCENDVVNNFQLHSSTASNRSTANVKKSNTEDTVDVLIKFFDKCGDLQFIANVHMDTFDQKNHRSLRVVGSLGTAVWHSSPTESKLEIYIGDDTEHIQDPLHETLYKQQLTYLINRIDTKDFHWPQVNGIDALSVISEIKKGNDFFVIEKLRKSLTESATPPPKSASLSVAQNLLLTRKRVPLL